MNVIEIDDDDVCLVDAPAHPSSTSSGSNAFTKLMSPQHKKRKLAEHEAESDQGPQFEETKLSALYPADTLPSLSSILAPKKDAAFWSPTKQKKAQAATVALSQVYALRYDEERSRFGCVFANSADEASFVALEPPPSFPPRTDNLDEWGWTKYYNEETVGAAEASKRFAWRPKPAKPKSAPSSSTTQATQVPATEPSTAAASSDRDGITLRSFFGPVGSFRVCIANKASNASTITVSFKMADTQPAIPLSALKSLFQKSIRRSRIWPSIRLAKALMCLNYVDFLRRLSIIIIEDALLHPDLPLVVWLMINQYVNPEYRPPRAMVNQLLRVVYDLAAVPYRDCVSTAWARIKSAQQSAQATPKTPAVLTPEQLAALPEHQVVLLKAIMARATFGGMHGDIHMLETAAAVWYHRFTTNNSFHQRAGLDSFGATDWFSFMHRAYNTSRKVFLDWTEVGSLLPGDLLLDGIDFHCTPVIGKVLSDEDFRKSLEALLKRTQQATGSSTKPADVEEQLKSAMWWFRSGINNKRNVVEPIPDSDETSAAKGAVEPLFANTTLRNRLDSYSFKYLKQFMV